MSGSAGPVGGTTMAEQPPAAEPSPEAVATYLARHPEFFVEHDALLGALTPHAPHPGSGVVDFQRFVTGRLQGELARLRSGQADIATAMRQMLLWQARAHRVALALIGARSRAQLLEIASVDLALHLEVDAVVIGLEADGPGAAGPGGREIRLWPRGRIDGWLPPGREALLRGAVSADPALFAGAAPLVRSLALLRLSTASGPGLLALGARDPTRFQAGQGGDLLLFLAQVLGLCLDARPA